MLRLAKGAAAAALFLFAVQAAPVLAQADGPVARPAVKAGDRWIYRRHLHEQNRVTGRIEYTVSFANDKVIQVLVDRPRKDGDVDETYTAEWNAIASMEGGNFTPHTGIFRFPLAVGASYPVAYENTMPRLGAFRAKFDGKAKVAGWEEVTVRAGTFRALKIELDGEFQRLDRSLSGAARTVVWYVPAVRRWVKWSYEAKGFRGRMNASWDLELIDYKLQ